MIIELMHRFPVVGVLKGYRSPSLIWTTKVSRIEVAELDGIETVATFSWPGKAKNNYSIHHDGDRFYVPKLDPEDGSHRGGDAMAMRTIFTNLLTEAVEAYADALVKDNPKLAPKRGADATPVKFQDLRALGVTGIDEARLSDVSLLMDRTFGDLAIVQRRLHAAVPEPFYAVTRDGLPDHTLPSLFPVVGGNLNEDTLAVFALGRLEEAKRFVSAITPETWTAPSRWNSEEFGYRSSLDDAAMSVKLAARNSLHALLSYIRRFDNPGHAKAMVFDTPIEFYETARDLRLLVSEMDAGEAEDHAARAAAILARIAMMPSGHMFAGINGIPHGEIAELYEARDISISLADTHQRRPG